jgi:hypothetical protein
MGAEALPAAPPLLDAAAKPTMAASTTPASKRRV